MWEQTLAVFFVLGLLVASLWLLRRKGFASLKLGFARSVGGAKRMELLERMPLTPHHSLHLVRVEDRLILIGVSPQSCALLDAFSTVPDSAALSAGAFSTGASSTGASRAGAFSAGPLSFGALSPPTDRQVS